MMKHRVYVNYANTTFNRPSGVTLKGFFER